MAVPELFVEGLAGHDLTLPDDLDLEHSRRSLVLDGFPDASTQQGLTEGRGRRRDEHALGLLLDRPDEELLEITVVVAFVDHLDDGGVLNLARVLVALDELVVRVQRSPGDRSLLAGFAPVVGRCAG